MKTTIVSFSGASRQTVKFEYPEYCPHCGKNISPEMIYVSDSEDSYSSGDARFVVTFRCSRSTCKKYFAVEYIFTSTSKPCIIAEYSYRPPIKVKLPENIEKVSPVFVEIYSQATIAEREALDQIAGVGYRKAAEFLIKDYAISKNPSDEGKIKSIMLGQVISTYLNDFPKIQVLAKSVAWIGNDETHYVRRHDGKDIDDLKKFILSATQFIAADYDADEALIFTSSSD
ncbi:TPA: DUF4145 domain-containing protein [Streptococcus pneumoniae]|uniref:DUF4145 domain-containing protein n=1 Tax=Streptococcus pneumoniae TaxID=1313 RepID=UPI0003C0DE4D|nr:DUF4145 domain-containing protein [Streptococcus pneumoniae]ESP64712.1 hypothetical protein BHN191_10534 [Streptococcus pneumoniae BHN191]MBW5036637.1 DUF4145 domain-containing protein [Streptococcus pneumoniae]MDA2877250.1 DUF4145 domain-containing protein [Streptococcus pneumoniae]MDG7607497.1 DUF4145 domain-containing protein [Streptococcus pneumoniae]MDG9458666.1 DUF4145 domain-containing protein [Streptococcus pneumoniae]